MMRRSALPTFVLAALLTALGPHRVLAQAASPSAATLQPPVTQVNADAFPAAPSRTAAPVDSAGPWAAALTFPAVQPATAPALAPSGGNLGAGKNLAMMGVGAAAVAIGLAVGGTGGDVIAISGGVLGLYGLYRFLQ